MPWSITYHEASNIVETSYEGMLSASDLDEVFTATIQTGLKTSCLLYLADLSRLEGGHTMTDLYAKAQQLKSIDLPKGIREALIVPMLPSVKPFVEFWEVVCRNQGFDLHTFSTREDALNWLVSKTLIPVTN